MCFNILGFPSLESFSYQSPSQNKLSINENNLKLNKSINVKNIKSKECTMNKNNLSNNFEK